jgi:hypothetical protein
MLIGILSVFADAANAYTISVSGGMSTNGSSQITSAASGSTVTLVAGNSTTGRAFYKWEVISGGVTLANAKSSTTTFTMGSSNVQVRAIFKLAGTVMPADELAAKCIDIADNYKTLYIMGCFGANMNASNKSRYTQNHSYNQDATRTAMINAASSDTFGFDCVCLIKGILWGWSGKIYSSGGYGGATYASNGVPDIGADSIINKCSNVSTTFNHSTMQVGELTWMSGHVGIYVGNKLGIECTPKWLNKVQWSSTNTAVSGYNQRNWSKHGLLPYVDYYADSNADIDQSSVSPNLPTGEGNYSVIVPSSSSLKGTSVSYNGSMNLDSSLTTSTTGTYAAFQPNGANAQKAYRVTMDYVFNGNVETDGYANSDQAAIVVMLGSGKTMGFNFHTGKYFIASGGGGWNGNPSGYIAETAGTLTPGEFYRFEYVIEASKLSIVVNGETKVSANVSGAWSADQYFIFYPKHVNLDVVYTKMAYIDGSSVLSTGSGSNALNGWNGMGAPWTATAKTYNVSFVAAGNARSYNVSVPSNVSYAGTSVSYTGGVNVDTSKSNGYAAYQPGGANPSQAYKVTVDLVYNGAVANDDYNTGDQGVILAMLGSSKTMGYNFATGKYFIAGGGGGWAGDPSGYVVQNSGTVSAGNFYRFEFTVEANKLTLAVNGTTVASANVSGAWSADQYFIFYPKHVNLDVVYTKMEYVSGALVYQGSGTGAFGGWNGMESAYSAINDTFSVSFNATAVHTHSLTYVAAVPATCTASGTAAYYRCSGCSKIFTDAAGTNETTLSALTVAATGHSYGAWTTVTAATCTAAGSEKRTCSKCSNVETRTVAALGHNYTTSTVAPTCTAAGYTSHICTRCGNTYNSDTVSATGHNYGAWTSVTAATCTTAGSEKRTCSKCSNVETRTVAALGHNYITSTVAPTCTAAGYTSHICTRCGNTYNSDTVSATGHNYGAWTTVTAATCTTAGSENRTCTKCSNVETRTVAALGHNYITSTVAPTCTAAGYTSHICTRCGNTYNSDTVAATGHNYGAWTSVTPATCTTAGSEKRTCTKCGATEQRATALASHNYVSGVCTVCGANDPSLMPIDPDVPQFAVNEVVCHAGEQVQLVISIKNNPGIAGMTLSFVPESPLTITKGTKGNMFSGFAYSKNLVVDDDDNVSEDGIVVTLTVDVPDGTEAGDYRIQLIVRECINIDYEDVELAIPEIKITVEENAAILYGDANGDGSITSRDVLVLRQYLANYDYDTETSTVEVAAGADANGDKTLSSKDVVIIRQYIANFDYDTGTSTVVLGPKD